MGPLCRLPGEGIETASLLPKSAAVQVRKLAAAPDKVARFGRATPR
jgi:hypothetical protein